MVSTAACYLISFHLRKKREKESKKETSLVKNPEQPPERPIVSGCGSITENISLFKDPHTKALVHKNDSHLQDTPVLLRHLEDLKNVLVTLFLKDVNPFKTLLMGAWVSRKINQIN